jgi:hypothetical protein
LLYFTANNLHDGMRVGDALKEARKKLDATSAIERLTILQFMLLGDPTLEAT